MMTCRLDQIFSITYGNKFDMNKMRREDGGIAFVGRRGTNQGVSDYVQKLPDVAPYPVGLLTVALGGAILASYVQQKPFYTAQNVAVLSPYDQEMPLSHRLYYASCIRHNEFRYLAFGREANRTLSTLLVPAEPPSWIDSLPEPGVGSLNVGSIFTASDIPSYIARSQASRVDEIFDVRYGHSLELNRQVKVVPPDGVDFVGRAARNNGVTARIALPSGVVPGEPGEITVALGGQGGAMASFVQQSKFVCGRDVAILTPKDSAMTLGEKLWWCLCLWTNHYRYGFGRQANRTLSSLLLPSEVPSFVQETIAAIVEASGQDSRQ